MDTFISHSPEETEALGEAWGRAAVSGLVIGLSGDLGAGKTQLARGVAHGLNFAGRVHSPTFTLVNQYDGGRLPLFHVDLYRLETRDQIITAGLEEYFHPAGVAVIEWAEKYFEVQGPRSEVRSREAEVRSPRSKVQGPKSEGQSRSAIYRRVVIETINETQRRISYEDIGG